MKKNILALDLGKGSLGISISRSGLFVTPLINLRFKAMDFDTPLAYLGDLLEKEKVETFVIGYPTYPSGDPCEMTEVVTGFIVLLKKAFPGIPVMLQDERYSTSEASVLLHDAGKNSRKQHKSIDAAASAVILERYLAAIGQADSEI